MKTLITTMIGYFLISHACFGTVLTVSNHPAGGAQYPGLQEAYNAAAPGDSLLIEGTDILYFMHCGQAWNKSLTVIGIGFNPNKQSPKRTKFRQTDCWSEFRIYAGGSGSRFYGIEFTHPVWSQGQSLSNMVLENCKFNVHFNFDCGTATNFVFRNCVFDQDNTPSIYFGGCGSAATGIISNCVIDGHIVGNNSSISSVVIEHCVFLNTNGSFSGVRSAMVRNNIFMNAVPAVAGELFNSTFDNNISRIAASLPPYPADGNTGTNNIEATDPQFVNVSPGAFYSPLHDYHLQAGSAAIGTANNGTDMGVHGGYSGFSEQGEVLINPIIRAMNILNTSVASNGTLNVQLHATKPDND